MRELAGRTPLADRRVGDSSLGTGQRPGVAAGSIADAGGESVRVRSPRAHERATLLDDAGSP